MPGLILSLFPGVGLLDKGFEEAGFCVVRGPDKIWGGDVKRFHAPHGPFTGVIGGPPCQCHSQLASIVKHKGKPLAEDLVPEFTRIVNESMPLFYLMENVPKCPPPLLSYRHYESFVLNNRNFGEPQDRERRFFFGYGPTGDEPAAQRTLEEIVATFKQPEPEEWFHTVCASGYVKPERWGKRGTLRLSEKGFRSMKAYRLICKLQGLPEDFLEDSPFTVEGKFRMVGNGVPLAMGRALARSVKLFLQENLLTEAMPERSH